MNHSTALAVCFIALSSIARASESDELAKSIEHLEVRKADRQQAVSIASDYQKCVLEQIGSRSLAWEGDYILAVPNAQRLCGPRLLPVGEFLESKKYADSTVSWVISRLRDEVEIEAKRLAHKQSGYRY